MAGQGQHIVRLGIRDEQLRAQSDDPCAGPLLTSATTYHRALDFGHSFAFNPSGTQQVTELFDCSVDGVPHLGDVFARLMIATLLITLRTIQLAWTRSSYR